MADAVWYVVTAVMLMMSTAGGTARFPAGTPASLAQLQAPSVSAACQPGAQVVFRAAGAGAARTPAVSTWNAADGSRAVRVVAADLDLIKLVYPTGRSAIALGYANERVEIRTDATGFELFRNGRARRFSLQDLDEAGLLQAQAMLAGSGAVRRLRLLASAVEGAAERTLPGMTVLVADALFGLLSGDVTAVQRLARRLARADRDARQVRAEPGCFEKYEAEVIRAWIDYEDCLYSVNYAAPWKELCGLRWFVWVESAFFSFIGCSALPIGKEG